MKNNHWTWSRQSRKIALGLLLRLLLTVAAYLLMGIVGYFVFSFVIGRWTWQPNDWLYQFLKWCQARWDLFAVVYLLVGGIGIFWYYWRKPFSYLNEVIEAAENIYSKENTPILLSAELDLLEWQLNQLKARVRENERAAREAEQRKNDLVAYLAHDLKTPITSVIGYLTLLREEKEISEELRQKYLQVAADKAERLDDLINEFFEITRFNLSQILLEYSKIDLVRLLEQTAFEFQPMLAEKGLTCRIKAPKELTIACDADKLQRVFDNLLRNAVNYSLSGGEIRIVLNVQTDQVRIEFFNQGNPISKERLEQIFERFYRLDSARASATGGSGLGLAIAKEIVERHHGKISADSQGEEIRFEIILPLALGEEKM